MWFDVILLAVFLGVTYAVASQGMWGAALMMFNVLFGGLIAMNFYEPAADFMASLIGAGGDYWYDIICIMLLFMISVFVLRMVTDSMSPMLVRFALPLDQAGRWIFGVWTAWVAISFLAVAVQTAPLPRTFLAFAPENDKFLGMGWPKRPDRQWLAFTQRASEVLLDRSGGRHVFDLWGGEQWDGRKSGGRPPTISDAQRSFIARYATRRAVAAGGAAAPPPASEGGGGAGDNVIF